MSTEPKRVGSEHQGHKPRQRQSFMLSALSTSGATIDLWFTSMVKGPRWLMPWETPCCLHWAPSLRYSHNCLSQPQVNVHPGSSGSHQLCSKASLAAPRAPAQGRGAVEPHLGPFQLCELLALSLHRLVAGRLTLAGPQNRIGCSNGHPPPSSHNGATLSLALPGNKSRTLWSSTVRMVFGTLLRGSPLDSSRSATETVEG